MDLRHRSNVDCFLNSIGIAEIPATSFYEPNHQFVRISNNQRVPKPLIRQDLAKFRIGSFIPLKHQFQNMLASGLVVINTGAYLGTVQFMPTKPSASILRITPCPSELHVSFLEYNAYRFMIQENLPQPCDPEGYLELDISAWPPVPVKGDQVCGKADWIEKSTDPNDMYLTRYYKRYVIRRVSGDHVWVLQARSQRRSDKQFDYACEIKFISGLGFIVPPVYQFPIPLFNLEQLQHLFLYRMCNMGFQKPDTKYGENNYTSIGGKAFVGQSMLQPARKGMSPARAMNIPKDDGTFFLKVINGDTYDSSAASLHFHRVVPEIQVQGTGQSLGNGVNKILIPPKKRNNLRVENTKTEHMKWIGTFPCNRPRTKWNSRRHVLTMLSEKQFQLQDIRFNDQFFAVDRASSVPDYHPLFPKRPRIASWPPPARPATLEGPANGPKPTEPAKEVVTEAPEEKVDNLSSPAPKPIPIPEITIKPEPLEHQDETNVSVPKPSDPLNVEMKEVEMKDVDDEVMPKVVTAWSSKITTTFLGPSTSKGCTQSPPEVPNSEVKSNILEACTPPPSEIIPEVSHTEAALTEAPPTEAATVEVPPSLQCGCVRACPKCNKIYGLDIKDTTCCGVQLSNEYNLRPSTTTKSLKHKRAFSVVDPGWPGTDNILRCPYHRTLQR